MKRFYLTITAVALGALLLPASIFAQQKEEKEKDKDKTEKTENKNVQQIIITKKGDAKDKIVVEINGDKVTVNGKPIEDLKDADISVNVHNVKGRNNLMAYAHPNGNWSYNWNDDSNVLMAYGDNTAMLGVVTEKADKGVKVTEVNDESAAQKSGLKEDDVITKVDDAKVEDPDDLTKAIRSHKPGDKVTITYLRDKKEQKATAELGKFNGAWGGNFKMPNMDFQVMPKIEQNFPNTHVYTPGQLNNYNGMIERTRGPKLGLSVQDTDDGKGVKVLEVDNDSNAEKAGVKKDDVILSVNDKDVNSADEVARIVRENKDKPSMKLKINRGGKTQTIEVKMPRKLKTTDI
jgi:serine protease Do